MFKSIVEDIIFLALLALAAYVLYTKWLKGWLGSGLTAVKATAAEYKADVKTIATAARSPWEVVNDLFLASKPYISQADYKNNIEQIKLNLQGKN